MAVGLLSCNSTPNHSTKEDGSIPLELNTNGSLEALNNRILSEPNRPDGYAERALMRLDEGDAEGALSDLELALKADSVYEEALELRAEILYQMQAFEASMSALDICIERIPTNTACLLRRAEIDIHLGQFERAFDRLNDALRTDGQLHEAYWMKGKIYEATGALEKAQSSYQTAVEVNPQFFDGYITLGVFLAKQNNSLAEEYYRSAQELRPGAIEPIYNLALWLQENARYNEALALYRQMLSIDPNNATASFNQGYIHLEYLQAYDSASHWFGEAIKRLPYYHQAFYNRGLARESLGDTDAALSDYNEALRIKPDYEFAALAKGRVLDTRYK